MFLAQLFPIEAPALFSFLALSGKKDSKRTTWNNSEIFAVGGGEGGNRLVSDVELRNNQETEEQRYFLLGAT